MSGRALVVGATGMLGAYIAEHLVELGWEVRALVRSRERARWLEDAGVGLVDGSLEDVRSLVLGASSCDAVFNAAAAIGSGGAAAQYRAANVDGVRNLVTAAECSGARLVHVSSTAVYGDDRYHDEPTGETAPLPALAPYDAYGRSKQDGERMVLEARQAGRIWASVVRPPVMYGIRDRQFAPRIGPVLMRGFFPRIAGGRTALALVHGRHVAEGAVLAGTTDVANGRVYLLTNDFPVTVTDLVRCAEAGLARRIFSPTVGPRTGRTGFVALAALLRTVGRSDLARHADGTLAMLTRDNPFTSARAREELGWSPTIEPERGLTEAFRHWRSSRAAAVAGEG